MSEKYDPVEHPAHYTQYKREVIELTHRLGCCMSNVAKYILRAPLKGCKMQDLQKAKKYLSFAVKYNALDKAVLDKREVFELVRSFDVQLLTDVLYARTASEAEHALEIAILQARVEELEKGVAEQKEPVRESKSGMDKDYDGRDYDKFWSGLGPIPKLHAGLSAGMVLLRHAQGLGYPNVYSKG